MKITLTIVAYTEDKGGVGMAKHMANNVPKYLGRVYGDRLSVESVEAQAHARFTGEVWEYSDEE